MIVQSLRLNWPQWQGGMDPNYQIGQEILAAIVPPSQTTPTMTVPVSSQATPLAGIDGGKQLYDQKKYVQQLLDAQQPQHLLILGGDCSVSATPFDYLHGKYPNDFGVIWLDAHPDISTPQDFHHLHEMVVADLLGQSHSIFSEALRYPLVPDQIFLAGLQVQELRPMDHLASDLKLAYATPDALTIAESVLKWLKSKGIHHVVIHFDLDALDPDDFRSILPAQPHLDRTSFGACLGPWCPQEFESFHRGH
ncbi:arginase family protein [Lactobacillus sp. DCY120]|uniref:Arginase family protein n=1 Tax=Bombilactobacillus apium TaxID=2675299 RepID=A0A850QVW7_9LACO|nr:arginase family protein [Bombilactobacillus apium]NVY95934.1 arginase family protein [Bombilactobacillus apium]